MPARRHRLACTCPGPTAWRRALFSRSRTPRQPCSGRRQRRHPRRPAPSPTTTIKPKENNPLKFSANVDDALHNLLVKRNAAYFEPVRAFEDAFDDVRNHQMAMLAGVRAAFEAMLAEFDPDRLQAEFDQQPRKGALISMPAKMRYWEMYREKVHGIVKDADTSFRELFGDEFARAYEEQLERLKDHDRGHSR